MPDEAPSRLTALLEASDPDDREEAWAAFLREYHRYILGTARHLSRDYDGAMDRYRFALEELRRDDYRRLRSYEAESRSRFSTWLVVVVRRLCRDFERKKYGRRRPGSGEEAEAALRRRRLLADLVVEELDPELFADAPAGNPDALARVEWRERRSLLETAVAGLSAEDRLILALRFRDDLPARRIAEVTGLPSPFHVYRRLKKILDVLRRRLEDRGMAS